MLKRAEGHDRFLFLLSAIFCLTAIGLAIFRNFDHDELEHIHCAWYLLQGKVPYLDFFQNHNPALWFLLAYPLRVLGEGIQILFLGRAFMLLFLAGIAVSVRALSLETGSSSREANYAVLFVVSSCSLINKGLEIRPDTPQVYFGLLSCLYILRYLNQKRPQHMALAGFLAGVSFVMLQKTVLLFAAIGISMLWLLAKRAFTWRAPILYAFGAFVPIACLALYLALTGCIRDYILTNWLLNANMLQRFSPLKYPLKSLVENTAFWALAAVSLWTCLFRKRGGLGLQMVSIWGLLLFGGLFLIPRPHRQYLIFPIALLAVPAARQAIRIFDQFKCTEYCRRCVLALILIAPWGFMASRLAQSNGPQLRLIRYVLSRTAPGNYVYDGDIQFNLFRPDLHYFWYSVSPLKGLDSYNRISAGHFASYDIHRLIEEKKPEFISDVSVNMADPHIAAKYQKTPFPHLYRLTGQGNASAIRDQTGQ